MSAPTSFYSLYPLSTVAPSFAPGAAARAKRARSRAVPATIEAPSAFETPPALICFCHLSWNGVWQRPQQFISRLSQNRWVLFVETHCSNVETSTIRTRVLSDYPNITVLEMHLPSRAWHNGPFIDRERRRLLREFQASDPSCRFDRPVLWFNDPMAVTAFAGHCDECAIVYDCMDELTQFVGAPANLLSREQELLMHADVVFCGGRKMRDKRLPINPNSHFYGTGVDCTHFGAARSPSLPTDTEIARLPGPVFGYFGVIDERLDYELIAKLADANPSASVAMVGPFAKINPAELPQRPNLYWLGSRAYTQLPAITRGFSVCLMPFALNAATEYINPTKALEYMAAGKPVVSTAIDEVKTNFAGECSIAQSHAEFIRLCQKQAAAPDAGKLERGLKLAADNTWESIAAKMEQHIADAVTQRSLAYLRADNAPTTAVASSR